MSNIRTFTVHETLHEGEQEVIREENLKNKCDSCVFEFATCRAKHVVFLEDKILHPIMKMRDSVVWCASYLKKD